MPSKPQPQRLIQIGVATYISALLLIAAFSIAFHFIADSIVHRQEASARIVNVSGRQRMLSQRIAKLSLDCATHSSFRTDAETTRDLNSAINLMAASHFALLQGSQKLGPHPIETPELQVVYFAQPYELDAKVRSFILHARAVADHPRSTLQLNDSDLAAVEIAAQEPILTALNAAVTAQETSSEHSIQSLRRTLGVLTFLMLVILLLEALLLYRPLFKRLGEAQKELILAGRTDPLTGSLNRRAFTEEAERAILRSLKDATPLSVLILDIDHFKQVNDTYGHPAGDLVINSVVKLLLLQLRSSDILCRMGGEEFAILLPHDAIAAAALAAGRFRAAIAERPVVLQLEAEVQLIQITVSVGVAEFTAQDTSLFPVLGRADRALYAAKQNGRNRVETEFTMYDLAPHGKPTLVDTPHTSRIRLLP